VYTLPRPTPDADLALMKRDDQDATGATIRMRERRRCRTEGRA